MRHRQTLLKKGLELFLAEALAPARQQGPLERRRDSLAKRAREFAKAEAEEAEFEDLEPKPKRSPKTK